MIDQHKMRLAAAAFRRAGSFSWDFIRTVLPYERPWLDRSERGMGNSWKRTHGWELTRSWCWHAGTPYDCACETRWFYTEPKKEETCT